MWRNLQNSQQVVEVLTYNSIFRLSEVVGWNTPFISATALMLYFSIAGLTPTGFQRIAMARNIKQAKDAFTYAAFIALFILACIAWVAVLLLADNPHLAPNKLVNYLIDKNTYVGFKGLLVSGIVALAMSTADSKINSCAVMFANDLAVPLEFVTAAKSTFIARVFSFLAGVLALLLCLYETDLLSLILLSASFYMPIVGIPLLVSILGFRSSKRAVLIAMAAGFITVLLWRSFLAYTGIDSVMPASLASLFFLFGSHYLLGEPGGWVAVAPDSPLGLERAARKLAWQRRRQAIRTFKLYPYLQRLLPQYEGVYTLVSFYAMAASYVGFYTIDPDNVITYKNLYETLYPTVLLANTLLLILPGWPSFLKNKRFLSFFWPISIAAIFFFAGMLLVILSHFHPMQVMVMMSNFLLVALFLPWSLALILACSGSGLAIWFFQQYTGEVLPWGALGLLQFRTIYVLLVFASLISIFFAYQKVLYQNVYATLIGLLFARKQQQFFERRLQDIAMHCSDATQGLESSVSRTAVMHLAYHIDQQVKASIDGHDYLQVSPELQKLVRKQQERAAQGIAFFKYFKPTAYAFVRQGKQLQDLLIEGLRSKFIAPRLERVSMSALVQSVVDDFLLSHKHVVVSVDLEKDFKAYVSLPHFRYTLLQILRFCTQSEFMEEQQATDMA